MRLFAAVRLSVEMKSALLQCQEEMRRQGVSGNFTRPENLHLTLAFIGETERAAEARRALEGIRLPAFSMALDGIGRFSSLWWAGIGENPSLQELARQAQEQLRAWGFSIERRPFQPHITLVRQAVSSRPIRVQPPAALTQVESLSLMCSQRIQGRLVYSEVYQKRLF
jgi:2'-5' RNA ligase